MLTCKQVSEALANGDYVELPLVQRLMLKLHVGTCVVCGKYNQMVMSFYDCVRGYLRYEDTHMDASAALSSEDKERMRRALADAGREDGAGD